MKEALSWPEKIWYLEWRRRSLSWLEMIRVSDNSADMLFIKDSAALRENIPSRRLGLAGLC